MKAFGRKKEETTEIAVKPEENTALANIPDPEEYAVNMGNEDYTLDDLIQPRLKLVQSMSHVCKKNHEEYNSSAKPGMYYLTSTRQLFDNILLVPVIMQKREIQYTFGLEKNKFLGSHLENSEITKRVVLTPHQDPTRKDIRIVDENGQKTVLINTAIWYVLLVNQKENRWERVTFNMQSSQLSPSRSWLTYLNALKKPSLRNPGNMYTPPFWMRAYRGGFNTHEGGWEISTFTEEIEFDLQTPNLPEVERQLFTALINDATAYYTDIKAGSVKVDHEEGE